MTTSGIYTFALTRDQAITLTLRKLNVLAFGTTPDSTSLSQANFSLNMMLKAWQTDGLKLWTVTDLIIPYTANKTTYTIGNSGAADIAQPRPLKAVYAYLRNTSVTPNLDIPMTPLTKQEYLMLGSKGSTGTTNSYFYDPLTPDGVLSVYLTPDAYTTANMQLHLVYRRPIQDMVNPSDTFDLPSEWSQAIVWNLAAEMAQDYQLPMERIQYIELKAGMLKNQISDWDTEAGSVYFQPDSRAQDGNG